MPLSFSLLIVEADEALREQFSRHFIAQGLDVMAVHHPRQALSAASFKNFHVAVIDQALPEMNGIQLMQRLKGQVVGLQPVLLTAAEPPESASNALAAGAFDCLLKPCRISELQRVVEEAIETLEPRPSAKTRGAMSISAKTISSGTLGARKHDEALHDDEASRRAAIFGCGAAAAGGGPCAENVESVSLDESATRDAPFAPVS